VTVTHCRVNWRGLPLDRDGRYGFTLPCGQRGWRCSADRQRYRYSIALGGGETKWSRSWGEAPVLDEDLLASGESDDVTCLMCLALLAGERGA
jgi:hypothetical protein